MRAIADAQFPAARRPNGHWGRGFHQPQWISTHYTLLDLKHLGIAPDHALIRASIGQVLARHKEADGGVNPAKTSRTGEVCVNGIVLDGKLLVYHYLQRKDFDKLAA